MFWQLNVVYGEHFYPRLHQAYRLLPQSEMPHSDEEKATIYLYDIASGRAKFNSFL